MSSFEYGGIRATHLDGEAIDRGVYPPWVTTSNVTAGEFVNCECVGSVNIKLKEPNVWKGKRREKYGKSIL